MRVAVAAALITAARAARAVAGMPVLRERLSWVAAVAVAALSLAVALVDLVVLALPY
jgi:hypothetical protein